MSAVVALQEGDDAPRVTEEVSLLVAAAIFLRFRRVIAALIVTGGALGAGLSLLRPTVYESSASFLPQSAALTAPSQLSYITGALGINLGSQALPGDSPEFYIELLRSHSVLERLAMDSFSIAGNQSQAARVGTLSDLLVLHGPSPQARVERAVRWLRDDAISADVRRGIVTINVASPSAQLSQTIAERALAYLGEFNVSKRQAQASAERLFVEGRLDVSRVELVNAEQDLEDFLQRNRQYQNSPGLVFTHDRAQRKIDMLQQVYTSLAQEYEQARIGEVRHTPVITVIDEPNLPVGAKSRHLLFGALAGLLLGGVLGTFLAFAGDHPRRQGVAADYPPVGALWRKAKDGLERIASPGDKGKVS